MPTASSAAMTAISRFPAPELKDLPDDMREAIVLCEWEEMAVVEAAAVLQSTPKAVESRLYRARNLLRERLKAWL